MKNIEPGYPISLFTFLIVSVVVIIILLIRKISRSMGIKKSLTCLQGDHQFCEGPKCKCKCHQKADITMINEKDLSYKTSHYLFSSSREYGEKGWRLWLEWLVAIGGYICLPLLLLFIFIVDLPSKLMKLEKK